MATRAPAVAGTFYPAEQLGARVDALLATGAAGERGHGIIVPHAGYRYSGAIAASVYGTLRSTKSKQILLLGPAHRIAFRGAALDTHDRWETPLGTMPIVNPCVESHLIHYLPEAHAQEHSLEVQLPFIQRTAPQATITPVLIGSLDEHQATEIAELLLAALPHAFWIVSTDLSHYLALDEARAVDATTLRAVTGLSFDTRDRIDACGKNPLLIAMKACVIRGWKPILVRYGTSGEETGDRSSVVGYAALRF